MSNKSGNRIAVLAAVSTCLALSHVARAEDDDLDKLPPDELRKALAAELDDVLEDKTPAGTEAELVADFMSALHDEGDSGDAAESVISWSELEDEMEEAGTTVQSVVAASVHEGLEADGDDGPEDNSESVQLTLGLDRIKAAYRSVLAAVFGAIEKKS